MAEAVEAPVEDVRRAEDVVKVAMADNLKFAVLIGLIEVGQVSNKEVVNTVLQLVSWPDLTLARGGRRGGQGDRVRFQFFFVSYFWFCVVVIFLFFLFSFGLFILLFFVVISLFLCIYFWLFIWFSFGNSSFRRFFIFYFSCA